MLVRPFTYQVRCACGWTSGSDAPLSLIDEAKAHHKTCQRAIQGRMMGSTWERIFDDAGRKGRFEQVRSYA